MPPGAKEQGSVRSARRWGQLSAGLGHVSVDLFIAATALEHGLTVVSRNLRHLTHSGVATLDPWAGRSLRHLGCHQSFLPRGGWSAGWIGGRRRTPFRPCQGYRGPVQIWRLRLNRKALTIAAPTNTRRVPGRRRRPSRCCCPGLGGVREGGANASTHQIGGVAATANGGHGPAGAAARGLALADRDGCHDRI